MALLSIPVCVMCGYRENSAKILLSYQRCWLIWSSSLFLTLYRLPTALDRHLRNDWPVPRLGLVLSDSLLRSPTPNRQRPSSFLPPILPVSQVHVAQLFVWSLLHNRQTKETSQTLWRRSKILKIRSLLVLPIHEHTHRPTHIHPYVYVYIYAYIHEHPLLYHMATKNIYCAKGESAVDYNTITRYFK